MTTEGTAGSGEISVAAGPNVGEERVQLLVRVPDVGREAVQVLDARDRPGADGRDELLKGQIRGICRAVGAGWVGRHSAPVSRTEAGGGIDRDRRARGAKSTLSADKVAPLSQRPRPLARKFRCPSQGTPCYRPEGPLVPVLMPRR